MKRIALLLTGLPRFWRQCMPSQLAMLEDSGVDIFFHFWDVISEAEKLELIAALKPRAYKFEAQQDFSAYDAEGGISKPDRINIPSRMVSQFYSWHGVAKLFEPFINDYDWAVRSRSDLQFVYSIAHIFPQLKPNDIVVNWWNHDEGSGDVKLLSDIFAFGDSQMILDYHKLYDHLPEYKQTQIFNPEMLITHHLHQIPNAHIISDDFMYYFIRRGHMDGYTVEQCMRENPGRNKWLDPEYVNATTNFYRMRAGEIGENHVSQFARIQLNELRHELAEAEAKKG
jgi:hypothetical protein